MELARKELLVARIVSGTLRCRVPGRREHAPLLIRQPSRDRLYIAQEIYQEEFVRAEEDGLYSEEELLNFLVDEGLWDDSEQKLFDDLPKEIENFKVELYRASFKTNHRRTVRKAIATAEGKLGKLLEKRNAYNAMSCVGVASLARARYVLGASLFYEDGRPVFTSDDFYEDENSVLDSAMSYAILHRIKEAEFRELSRTEPWRSVWCGRKCCGSVFGCASADMTEEQKAIVSWSTLYDSVYEHPECPPDAAMDDDYMLDGWLIIQRREREKGQTKGLADGLNDKVKGSQQVYIPADTPEDAAKIDGLNDVGAKIMKRQREKVLKERGMVNELAMPDTAQRLRMELNKKFSQHAKGV